MISNSVKMAEVSHCEEQPLECYLEKCHKKIGLFDKYFLDTLWDRTFCHQCGLCLRYARKQAIKRGEMIEKAEIDT